MRAGDSARIGFRDLPTREGGDLSLVEKCHLSRYTHLCVATPPKRFERVSSLPRGRQVSLFSTIVDTGGGPDLPEATRGDRAGRDSFRYSTRDTRICIFSSFFSFLFLVDRFCTCAGCKSNEIDGSNVRIIIF